MQSPCAYSPWAVSSQILGRKASACRSCGIWGRLGLVLRLRGTFGRLDLIRPVIGRTSCTRLVSRVSPPTTLSFVKGLLADERQLGPEIFF